MPGPHFGWGPRALPGPRFGWGKTEDPLDPIRESTVFYLRMDETSGDRTDQVGGLTLGDVNTVASAAGKVGLAGSFTAANGEYLSRPSADAAVDFNGDSPFSVSLWFSSTKNGTFQMPISTNDGTKGWEVQLPATGFLRFHAHVSSAGAAYLLHEYQTDICDGVLRHIVCTYDGSLTAGGVTVYVNGVAVSLSDQSAGTPVAASIGALRVGARGGGGSFTHNGLIDEVGIHDRVLTSDEAALLWNGGAGVRLI